jgi:DNA-binding MarR family transcriptional regulator
VLWHATQTWQQEVARVLAPFELTHAQFTTLGSIWWLRRETGVAPSQRDVAEHNGVTVMLVSQVLQHLERRELVRRTPDPVDSRVRRLALTRTGGSLTKRALTALDAADLAYFADLDITPEQLLTVLRQIARRDAAGLPLPRVPRRTS